MTEYEKYIERMETIRKLSTPSLDEIDDADGYSRVLRDNFTRIGQLAALNREFLENTLYPMISLSRIDSEDIEKLTEFGNDLINPEQAESIDLPMVNQIAERLASIAKLKGDLVEKIVQADYQIGVIYGMMNMTRRIKAYPEISARFRMMGFEIADFFFSLLDAYYFDMLKDVECRQIVITNARYGIAFFEGIENDPKMNRKQLARLKWMREIHKDPHYVEMLGDYDWIYHRFRALQYALIATENNNAAGFDREQLEWIYDCGREMTLLWEENEDHLMEILGSDEDRNSIDILNARIEYLTGRKTLKEYRRSILMIYSKREVNSYASGRMYTSLVVPVELSFTVDRERISERVKGIIFGLYKDMISYVLGMPNSSTLSGMLEYFNCILDNFIEIPSCISFEDMALKCLAALHPPTYVHSQMVGLFTECLCGHVSRLMPEKLIGVCGFDTLEEVTAHKDEILNFAYHAALCHDLGKASIIDTVMVYGRKLLDQEFDLIKTHPRTGSELMKRFASTRKYADVALGHHKWYDNSRGYPVEFDTSTSREKPIIDIVLCADCLDAATDTIGRSYSKGKSLSDFIAELKEGAGTRYAPWLPELFEDPDVFTDIEFLLKEGRQKEYKNTYHILKTVHDR